MSLKAHTYTLLFGGSVVKSAIESVDSIAESADSTTNSVIVDGSRPTIAVSQRQIGLVGMGLQ